MHGSATSSSFLAFSERWLPLLESALQSSLTIDDPNARTLEEAMRYAALSPGKRIRPLLCLMACDVCKGNPEAAMPAACAIELIHAFSLVHDDLPCMDDDDLRRGRPTTHKVYGEAMALLAGDGLLAQSFLLTKNLPSCHEELSHATMQMIIGQTMDMQRPEPSVEFLDALCERKTGALITCALRMGGLVAGASEKQMTALSAYGRCLGLIFQLTDDLIDVSGSKNEAGKAVGKDLSKGKKTYPHLIGIDACHERVTTWKKEAEAALSVFDQKADGLSDLLEMISTRTR